jgi:hypothetical protein
VTEANVVTPQGTVEVETTTSLQYPDRVHVETRLPTETVVQIYDGRRAWIRDAEGIHDVPEQAIRELQASLKRDTLAALVAVHDGRLRARLLPDVPSTGGTRLRAVELSGAETEPVVLYIDPRTHLVMRQTYVGSGEDRPFVEETFSDYRLVDGVQIAFLAQVRRAGRQLIERRVTDIAINPLLPPTLFRRPVS